MRLKDISLELDLDENNDEFWLFTKYDDERQSNYSE